MGAYAKMKRVQNMVLILMANTLWEDSKSVLYKQIE